jgi:hypothetical protein
MRVFRRLPATDIHLEAEVADRRVPSFIVEYRTATGITLRAGVHFQVQPSANDNKRGLEGRVYFNATPAQVRQLRTLGFRVQGPRTRGYLSDRFAYRIDRNSLFWLLIRSGHRL